MNILAITGPRCRPEHLIAFRRRFPALTVVEDPTLEAAEDALRQKPDAVLLFGGDGTLNRYLHLLIEAQIPLLTAPTGSGNDFAQANGIATLTEAEKTFAELLAGAADFAAVDVGHIRRRSGSSERSHAFACCVNVGLDADAAARANGLPDWLKSRKGYFLAGAASILRYQPQVITVGGPSVSTISEEAWFVAISNTPTFGGGLKIAPEASITDGLFDVTYVPRIDRRELIRHYPKILRGTHTELPFIRRFRAASVEIYTERPSEVYADGEYMGKTPMEVTVTPRAIAVLTRGPA
jgi:diacylglycerol kinase (ATP)